MAIDFLVCGVEHSGTTLVSDLFRQIPHCESGFEVGDAEEVLEEVDTSHDDKVSYNEFVVWMCMVGCLDNANIKAIAQKHHEKALERRASGLSLAEQLAQEQEQYKQALLSSSPGAFF